MKDKIEITKEVRWEAAHRLFDPTLSIEENRDQYGPCARAHGHSYRLQVTVAKGQLPKDGMVVNFTKLKKILQANVVDIFDHKLLLTTGDPLVNLLKEEEGLVLFDEPTTCEHQVKIIRNNLVEPLKEAGVKLVRLRLWETANSFCDWIEEAPNSIEIVIEKWIESHSEEERNKPFLVSPGGGGSQYSMNDLLKEIRKQTSFGQIVTQDIAKLTLDLLFRGKESFDRILNESIIRKDILNND
jgi:6-pyruvoyltetrahydropterin/6-carboxytetrahydropterin synthase